MRLQTVPIRFLSTRTKATGRFPSEVPNLKTGRVQVESSRPTAILLCVLHLFEAVPNDTAKSKSYTVIWDSGASICIGPTKENFISYTTKVDIRSLQSFYKSGTPVKGMGCPWSSGIACPRTIPKAVALSVFREVPFAGYDCPMAMSVLRCGMICCLLMKRPPHSTLAAEETTFLILWHTVWIGPLAIGFGGPYGGGWLLKNSVQPLGFWPVEEQGMQCPYQHAGSYHLHDIWL